MWRVLVMFLLLPLGCRTNDEWQIRQAVRRVVAGEADHKKAMRFVVEKGRRSLTDIEQQMHAAPAKARLRLVRLVGRIGDVEAVTFLELVARWDTDDKVRNEAKLTMAALRLAR